MKYVFNIIKVLGLGILLYGNVFGMNKSKPKSKDIFQALENGKMAEASQLILKADTEVLEEENREGYSLLMYAAENGLTGIARSLLDKKVYPTSRYEAPTPLMLAAKNNHLDTVKLLRERHPELINEIDRSQKTALIYSAEAGHNDIVIALLELGANITPKDGKGKTAADYAKNNDSLQGIFQRRLIIQQLTPIKVDPRNSDDCTICQDKLKGKETVVMTPACSHLFHQKCLTGWLFRNGTCPLCRREISYPKK